MHMVVFYYSGSFSLLGSEDTTKTLTTAYTQKSKAIPATYAGSRVAYIKVKPLNSNSAIRDVYVDNIKVLTQLPADGIEDEAVTTPKIAPLAVTIDKTEFTASAGDPLVLVRDAGDPALLAYPSPGSLKVVFIPTGIYEGITFIDITGATFTVENGVMTYSGDAEIVGNAEVGGDLGVTGVHILRAGQTNWQRGLVDVPDRRNWALVNEVAVAGDYHLMQSTTNTGVPSTRSVMSWNKDRAATTYGSLAIGQGAAIAKVLTATATLDFGDVIAQEHADLTITVTGAMLEDVVTLGTPNASVEDGICYTAWVSASDTVKVRCNNYGKSDQNPASGTFRVMVTQF